MTARLPDDEAERLAALREHRILDTPPEDDFDDLVRLAAHICGVPIAAVSLIDEHRQWFKSVTGLDVSETPRGAAFCAHTILEETVFVVPDAQADPRFRDNPLVTGDPNIRFYAGAPLVTESGHALGSLCVIDRVPRQLTEAQQDALRVLARQVSGQMTLRRRVRLQERMMAERAAADAERQRLAAIVEASADAIISTDREGKILSWNGGAERLYGFATSEVVGQCASVLAPRDRPRLVADVLLRLGRAETVEPVEVAPVRKDGTGFHASLTFSPIRDAAGEMTGLSCIARDVTAHSILAERLRESEARFRTSVDAMEEGLALQDAAGAILFCNGSAERILGLSADQMMERTSFDPRWRAVYPDGTDFPGDRHPAMIALRECIAQRNVVMGVHKPDGELTWVNINAVPLCDETQEQAKGVVVTFSDITERRLTEERIKDHAVVLEFQKQELEKANAELESLATTDGLTGLWNHRTFQERLAEETARAARYGQPLSVVLMDVDHFKLYNDAFGHPAGDRVLKTVAGILQNGARHTDMVARYGGEEFVFVLPQTDGAAAAAFAERARAAIERHGWPVRAVTASFGVATLRVLESGTELLARADAALYRSKSAGRNCVRGDGDAAPGPAPLHDIPRIRV